MTHFIEIYKPINGGQRQSLIPLELKDLQKSLAVSIEYGIKTLAILKIKL